jgi:rhodanese-related sulfurtransferase
MKLKNRRGKVSVRLGVLGGAALLLLGAIFLFTKLQNEKHNVDSDTALQLNAQEVPHTGLVEAHKAWSGRSALFLDLRPNSAFARTHIPGAISIPADELESRFLDLPNDRMIITYCDYPLEECSAQAALFLITHGFPNTTSLRGGIDGWIQSGYPIEP